MHFPLKRTGKFGEQIDLVQDLIVAVLVLCDPTHTSLSFEQYKLHVVAYNVPETSRHCSKVTSLSSRHKTEGCSPVVREFGQVFDCIEKT